MDGTADSREGPDSGDMDDEPGAGPGGGGDKDVCIICYEASPPPIPSGCACRGPSALAHVACRIRAAEIMGGHRGQQVWSECLTCQQGYTGPVLAGLANAWWTQVRDRPEEDLERLAAAQNLAGSVFQQGDYTEAAGPTSGCEIRDQNRHKGLVALRKLALDWQISPEVVFDTVRQTHIF